MQLKVFLGIEADLNYLKPFSVIVEIENIGELFYDDENEFRHEFYELVDDKILKLEGISDKNHDWEIYRVSNVNGETLWISDVMKDESIMTKHQTKRELYRFTKSMELSETAMGHYDFVKNSLIPNTPPQIIAIAIFNFTTSIVKEDFKEKGITLGDDFEFSADFIEVDDD